MSVSDINAEIRTEFGKGGARRTRRAGKMPAVLYGHGESPRHLSLPSLEFAAAIRWGGMTNVLTLRFPDGSTSTALPKAIQRDALKDVYTHADLLLVHRGEKVTVEIPVVVTGEPARGVLVMHETATLAVNADATRLPDQLEVSVDGLPAGTQITAADVTLPEGSELISDRETVLVVLGMTRSAAQAATEEAGGESGESAGESGEF